jgi:hypothetical protein
LGVFEWDLQHKKMPSYTSAQSKTSHQISFCLIYSKNFGRISIPFPPLRLLSETKELFYPFSYLPSFVTDSIRSKNYRMINHLSLPVFLFNPLTLEMARVTITTSNTNMWGSLVTIYTFLVLWIDAIWSEILVHDSVMNVAFV